MQFHELLETLARTTWKTIKSCSNAGIQLGEDAITSWNLTSIALHESGSVVVEDTRVNESTKGCDFELWVGSVSTGWNRYAIQAKKISPKTGQYSRLNHKVNGLPQIKILESYAKSNRAASLYCFFNNCASPSTWSCTLPDEKEQLGCSVAPSKLVLEAINTRGARNFSWIHNSASTATLPWRCLVRCPSLVNRGKSPLRGWPAPDTYWHAALPTALRRLQELRTIEAITDSSAVLNNGAKLRPAWIGIIDVSETRGAA